jgi:hypothetical protein
LSTSSGVRFSRVRTSPRPSTLCSSCPRPSARCHHFLENARSRERPVAPHGYGHALARCDGGGADCRERESRSWNVARDAQVKLVIVAAQHRTRESPGRVRLPSLIRPRQRTGGIRAGHPGPALPSHLPQNRQGPWPDDSSVLLLRSDQVIDHQSDRLHPAPEPSGHCHIPPTGQPVGSDNSIVGATVPPGDPGD